MVIVQESQLERTLTWKIQELIKHKYLNTYYIQAVLTYKHPIKIMANQKLNQLNVINPNPITQNCEHVTDICLPLEIIHEKIFYIWDYYLTKVQY